MSLGCLGLLACIGTSISQLAFFFKLFRFFELNTPLKLIVFLMLFFLCTTSSHDLHQGNKASTILCILILSSEEETSDWSFLEPLGLVGDVCNLVKIQFRSSSNCGSSAETDVIKRFVTTISTSTSNVYKNTLQSLTASMQRSLKPQKNLK